MLLLTPVNEPGAAPGLGVGVRLVRVKASVLFLTRERAAGAAPALQVSASARENLTKG